MRARELSILVLCDDDRAHASNLLEHLHALQRYSRHRVRLYNARGVPHSRFLDLDEFDVVVVHYSLVVTSDNYVSPWLREKIRAFRGLKVQFLQDEYRWVDDVTAMMQWLGIDVLFSIVPPRAIGDVYGGRLDGIEIVPTLAGFVPESLIEARHVPPLGDRPIHVGYRGRALPYWIGALSQEKIAIARGFAARAREYGLRCDIAWSEADRIYGAAWYRFLASCRTTLGTESGASITDFDGSIERRTLEYLERRPDAPFEEVFDAVLAPYEGNVMMNVVSPRVFEAAALETALVMFPGEYGGVVEPWRHYVPLKKDFSNMDEVVAAIEDLPTLEEMTARTREEVIASGQYSLRTFVAEFDAVADARATSHGRRTRSYVLARLERPVVTRTVHGYDVREGREEQRRRLVALQLVRDHPPLSRLFRAFLADREMRARVGVRKALSGDFLRLALLVAAHSGERVTTEPFAVVPTVEEEGTLTLAAVRPEDWRPPPDAAERARRLAAEGEVPTLLWNHTAIAPLVFIRRENRRNIGLQVGYHRFLGVYHFTVVEALARRHRQLVVDALASLFEPPVPPVVTPSPAPFTSLTLHCRATPHTFALARLAARAALTSNTRGLVAAWLHDPQLRRSAPLARLVRDLGRLRALHDAWAARAPMVASVDAVQEGEELRIVVGRDRLDYFRPWDALDRARAPARIVWDNRALGESLCVRGSGRVVAGPDGLYEFTALAAAFDHAPEAVWDALAPVEGRALLRRLTAAARHPRAAARTLIKRDAGAAGARGMVGTGLAHLRRLGGIKRHPRDAGARGTVGARLARRRRPGAVSAAAHAFTIVVLAARAAAAPQTWPLLGHWLMTPKLRRSVRIRMLVRDLGRLRALHDLAEGRSSGVTAVAAVQNDDELRFVVAAERGNLSFEGGQRVDRRCVPARVLWDNRLLGENVVIARRRVYVGAGGVYEFRTLAAAFASDADAAWAAALPREARPS